MNNNGLPPNAVQVQITPDDAVRCECGSEAFVPFHFVAKVKPLIGQPPILIGTPSPAGWICSSCGKMININNCKTKKEINNTPKIIKP